MKLKVGDKVKCIRMYGNNNRGPKIGMIGTVKRIHIQDSVLFERECLEMYAVEFDAHFFGAHGCGDCVKALLKNGWWIGYGGAPIGNYEKINSYRWRKL